MIDNFTPHLDARVMKTHALESEEALKNSGLSLFFDVSNDNEYVRTDTSTEWGSGVDYLDEEGNVPNVTQNQGWTASATSREFGGQISISYKERLNARDETTLFDKVISRKLTTLVANTATKNETWAMALINDGFTTALAPDTNPIFGTHTWLSTSTTFDNGSTTAAGETALTEIESYGWNFKDAQGEPMPMRFDTIYVKTGGTASVQFRKVLDMTMVPDQIGNVNIYNNGRYKLVESAFITSDTAWYARDTRAINPLIVDYIDRPNLEKFRRENRNDITNQLGSFRFACMELPLPWYGSTGV